MRMREEKKSALSSNDWEGLPGGRKVLPYRWYPSFRPVTTVVGDQLLADMIT